MKFQTYMLIGLILVVILIGGCIQIETGISEEEHDRQTIAQLSLEWAIIGKNIPDFHLINDPNNIIVSTRNINKSYNFSLENITFNILTPEEIQQKSNNQGDFLYFEFEMLDIIDNSATVKLNNIWAVSEENKKNGSLYLSGGGATIPFKKERGRWLTGEATEIWMS